MLPSKRERLEKARLSLGWAKSACHEDVDHVGWGNSVELVKACQLRLPRSAAERYQPCAPLQVMCSGLSSVGICAHLDASCGIGHLDQLQEELSRVWTLEIRVAKSPQP